MTEKKRGLGRGLGDLLSPPDWLKGEDIQLFYCPIQTLFPNPHQPRQRIIESELDELVQSIREKGVLQPILVTRSDRPDHYQILAGERRWRSAKIAGLTEVPVLLRESTPSEGLEIALIENIQRRDLNCIEEALAFQRLQQEFNMTQEEIAKRVGKDRSTVANLLRILQLPTDIQEAVLNQQITMGHARALLALPDPNEQRRLCARILARQLSVRQTETLVADASVKKVPPRKPNPDLLPIKTALQARLGTRVTLKRNGQRGTITLAFDSDTQFQQLLTALGLPAFEDITP